MTYRGLFLPLGVTTGRPVSRGAQYFAVLPSRAINPLLRLFLIQDSSMGQGSLLFKMFFKPSSNINTATLNIQCYLVLIPLSCLGGKIT